MESVCVREREIERERERKREKMRERSELEELYQEKMLTRRITYAEI